MSASRMSIAVKVDVTNPGQFFACCGLLELANCLWPGAEGWFDSGSFHVSLGATADADILGTCLRKLRKAELRADDSRGDHATRPVHLTITDESELILDWWIDAFGKKTFLKLWAGQQMSIGIIRILQEALPDTFDGSGPFDIAKPLTGRFGVDPRSAWNALDVGFSPNDQKMEVSTHPLVELLAAIGLQGFRPTETERRKLRYSTWSVPLPAAIARMASAGVIPAGDVRGYSFGISTRGNYKAFEFARIFGDET